MTAPWANDVLEVLKTERVDGLALWPESRSTLVDALSDISQITSLRSLWLDWPRTPPIPEATLRSLDDLEVIGKSGYVVPTDLLDNLTKLTFRPGRISGPLSQIPHLDLVMTRGLPPDGLDCLDGCERLRLVRFVGRGTATPRWTAPPIATTSIITSGIALTDLDALPQLPILTSVEITGGHAAKGLTLDLSPLLHCPKLSRFTATGYDSYLHADEATAQIDFVWLK